MHNTITKIARFFQTNKKPLNWDEFYEFWGSLSEYEQVYYRVVNLKTGLLPER